MLDWVREEMLADGLVSPGDLELLHVTDEPQEAVQRIVEMIDARAAEGSILSETPDVAIGAIAARSELRPRVGVVLGSGLGPFADAVAEPVEIPYGDIPGWPASTAVGHAGTLVLGRFGDVPVAVMKGRRTSTRGFPRRTSSSACGCSAASACGASSSRMPAARSTRRSSPAPVAISDHLNLQGSSPLVGPNDETVGPRFPDMTNAYDAGYRAIALQAAARLGLELGEGVYAAWLGPAFETPAEIRMMRALGADLVGMSTVPEVLAARHMGIRCLALSCVTNAAAGVRPEPIDHERVLEVGARAAGDLVALLREVVPLLD